MSSQPGPIRTGTFHTDTFHTPVAAHPRHQPPISRRCDREPGDTDHTTHTVHHSGDMFIQMRIDTTDHRTGRIYDGHGHPLSKLRGDPHVPGRRPLTEELFAQHLESPSGTGRVDPELEPNIRPSPTPLADTRD